MRRLGRVALAAVLGGVLLGLPAVASAVHSSPTTPAASNGFGAGSLNTPTTLRTVHPNVTGSGDGDVRLTWSDTLPRAITYLVQRAPAAAPTSWVTVNGAGNGSASTALCTGAVPGAVTCAYDDNATNSTLAPSYNASYVYQVVAKVGGWTAPAAARYAGSLPAASGDDTYLVPPDLNAVSAASATSVWAVGANCTVDYFNGTSWTLQTVPTGVCPTGTSLNGVAANGGLPMIVGAVGTSFICTALCTTATPTWSAKATPGFPTLNAVSAASATQMWAVGPSCTVLFYNGTTWTAKPPSAAACAAGTTLNGVSENGGKPIFVGAAATIFTCTAGCTATPTWTVNSSGAPGGTTFYAVHSIGNAWAVGSGGVIAVCYGANCDAASGTWTTQTSGTTATLRGVFADGNNLVDVVGDGGTALQCAVNCNKATGSVWGALTSNTTENLSSVTMLSATASIAVGRIGTILRSGAGWAPLATGVTADLKAVSGVSATSVWAVGANCTVLHYDGSSWSQQTVGTGACPAGTSLNGVTAIGGKPMIVGDNGVTFVCTGTVANCASAAPTWTSVSTAAVGSPSLNAVSANTAAIMWAVGANCSVLYFNGAAWSAQTPPTAVCPAGTTLRAVHQNNLHPVVGGDAGVLMTCTGGGCDGGVPSWIANAPVGLSGSPAFYAVGSATNVWAAGSGGTIAVCTGGCGGGGAAWAVQTSGTTATLRAISAVATTLMDVAGDAGTLRQCTTSCTTTGATWTAQDPGTTTNLTGVYLVDAANAHVVGPGGAAFGLGTPAFGVVTATSLPVNIPTTYTLSGGDLTKLNQPDTVLYAVHGAWPATALPSTCTSTTPAVMVRPASTLPSGTWGLNKAVATVIFQVGAVPSGGAAFQLLVSPDGSTWTGYPLTAPTSAGTPTTASVDVTSAIASTAALATTKLCLQGTSGSGPSLTTAVDLMHLDVN